MGFELSAPHANGRRVEELSIFGSILARVASATRLARTDESVSLRPERVIPDARDRVVDPDGGSWGLLLVPVLICVGMLLFAALSSNPAGSGSWRLGDNRSLCSSAFPPIAGDCQAVPVQQGAVGERPSR